MSEPFIAKGIPVQKVIKSGRPKESGCNARLLRKLCPDEPDSCIWGCSRNKMNSLRVTAQRMKLRTKIRVLEDGLYAIWVVSRPKTLTPIDCQD